MIMLECSNIGKTRGDIDCGFCNRYHEATGKCYYAGINYAGNPYCYSWARNIAERDRLDISEKPKVFGNYTGLFPTHSSPVLGRIKNAKL